MIFAVDVIGDRAAEGYVFCAGRDGKKPAARHGEVEDLRERYARFGGQNAAYRVKGKQPVHPSGLDQGAVLEQADVAVAAPHADGQRSVVDAVDDARELVLPMNGAHVGVVDGVAPPGLERRLDRLAVRCGCRRLDRGRHAFRIADARGARSAPKSSAEALILLPELRPRETGRTAEKDVRVVLALFVVHARRIRHMRGEPAVGELLVGVVGVEAGDDE